MNWIIEPISGFQTFDPLAADTCTGEGSRLNSCSCSGGLVVCQCSGGLTVPKQQISQG